MANIYKTFGTDDLCVANGVWFDLGGLFTYQIGDEKFVTRFKLKHQSDVNIEYQRNLARLQKPYLKDIRKDRLDADIAITLGIKAFCSSILVDWENLPIRDENVFAMAVRDGSQPVINYSFEAACELMRACPDLMVTLQELAKEPQNFQLTSVEEQVEMGNASNGDLSGNLKTQNRPTATKPELIKEPSAS